MQKMMKKKEEEENNNNNKDIVMSLLSNLGFAQKVNLLPRRTAPEHKAQIAGLGIKDIGAPVRA